MSSRFDDRNRPTLVVERIGVLESDEAPVSRAIVAICEKCGKKLMSSDTPNEENPSRVLQKLLKSEFKETFGPGVVRPVVSSCLDVCPEGRVTLGVFPVGKEPAMFYTFELGDADRVTESLERILK